MPHYTITNLYITLIILFSTLFVLLILYLLNYFIKRTVRSHQSQFQHSEDNFQHPAFAYPLDMESRGIELLPEISTSGDRAEAWLERSGADGWIKWDSSEGGKGRKDCKVGG